MTHETVERFEAAWLLTQGIPLVDAKIKDESHLVQFIFEDQDGLVDQALTTFNNHRDIQNFIVGFERVQKIIRREQDERRDAETRGGQGR